MTKYGVLVGILAASLFTGNAYAQHKAPNQQPPTAGAPSAPTGEMTLGTVTLNKPVTADGKPLKAGTYQVRLTAQEAKPDAAGSTESLERWVEFLQRGKVQGREVVTIIPQSEIKEVEKDKAPAAGASKVQLLKGNEYVRVWINKGGNHFLIHMPAAGAATKS